MQQGEVHVYPNEKTVTGGNNSVTSASVGYTKPKYR